MSEAPHLFLHLDVNKTVLVDDEVQGLDVETSCAQIMGDVSWGHVRQGRWVWDGQEPRARCDDPDATPYSLFVRASSLPRQEKRALRRRFLRDGHPGERLRPHYDQLLAALRLDDAQRAALEATDWAARAGLDRGHVRLLPSFFHLLRHLDKARPRATLIFRTYGTDLPALAEELNAFCEGRHPCWPGIKMDGRGGTRDWRLRLDLPERFGALHRGGRNSADAQAVALALGTLDNPPGRDKPPYPCPYAFFEARAARMLTSADQLWDHLWAQRAHTLALRDDYAFWARHRFTAAAGKPLRVHLRDPARQDLFFDDNVHDDDAHIIDARDPRGRALPWGSVRDQHVLRVDPYRAILEEDYFTRQLPPVASQGRAR